MTLFEVQDRKSHLLLKFHAPRSSNAFSLQAARELDAVRKEYENLRKPVVVASAHPRLFCSGGNLSDYKKLKGRAPGLKINREIAKILDRFGRWPVPKLARIEGDSLGGGMEWLARFDFRFATPEACFSFWQKRIGLTTGWGGGKAWADKIGGGPGRQVLVEGGLLTAVEARDLGAGGRVGPGGRPDDAAEEWCAGFREDPLRELTGWSAKAESRIFAGLWMAERHAAVLKRWR